MKIFLLKMEVESDPNVIYGGDPIETDPVNYASLGDMIVGDLKFADTKPSFVSRNKI